MSGCGARTAAGSLEGRFQSRRMWSVSAENMASIGGLLGSNSRSAPTRQGGCSANSFVTRVSKIGSKDRQRGIIGKVKEVAGKVLGDAKLKSEGNADQAAGKVQNAVGGLKDTLRGK